jgi:hypothetical protein
MELGSYFLFLQEQTKDSIIIEDFAGGVLGGRGGRWRCGILTPVRCRCSSGRPLAPSALPFSAATAPRSPQSFSCPAFLPRRAKFSACLDFKIQKENAFTMIIVLRRYSLGRTCQTQVPTKQFNFQLNSSHISLL